MRKNFLTKEQVDNLTPADVHATIGRVMLADGFSLVVDLEKSCGMYIYDSRNQCQFLDFFSYFGSWALGHNHPKMQDEKFLKKIAHVAPQNPSNSDLYTVEMAQFIATFERVCMPEEFTHVFFIAGGGLAVENALKAAMDWKVRKNLGRDMPALGGKILHFKQAFHGRTGYTLSLTNTFDPRKTEFFTKFLDWPRVENPKCIFPLEGENLAATQAAETRAIAQIMCAIAQNPDDIAAILIEPVQAEGGDNHFRPEFFAALRRICDENEIMLIFDEVQTGVGLSGKMWTYEHTGVVPDLVAFGKKLQICGFMSTSRIDEIPENVFAVESRINSTWGGSLTDMVRAQRILEIIEEDNLVENAAKVGEYLQKRLAELAKKYPTLVSNVRGKGLLCAFDLPTCKKRDKVRGTAYSKGLIVLSCGEKSIRFRPALIASNEDVDKAVAILDSVLGTI